ncbi:hypothetical protein BG015_000146 [Linnemannia schmuckeri]|uniref:Uncharacterized protein n=1 Tax=Linnemannia schmuckeri TaxID=64567 RepID=A0A9P5RRG6_9FUNG|nr:hypothetical protein BG015_000146 [Linnemannia schmuckeri]
MALKQDSQLSSLFNNDAGGHDDSSNNKDKNMHFVSEASGEAEADEVSEQVALWVITYTVNGTDYDDDYDNDDDDEDLTMPYTIETFDEPDLDAIARGFAPLTNDTVANNPIEDD